MLNQSVQRSSVGCCTIKYSILDNRAVTIESDGGEPGMLFRCHHNTSNLLERKSNPKLVDGKIELHWITDENSELINSFSLLQRFIFIIKVSEQAHHPFMCPSIGVLWVPQNIYNDYIQDRGIDEESIGELLGTKIVVHGIFQRMTLLEELILLLITRFLILLPYLRMLLLVMFMWLSAKD